MKTELYTHKVAKRLADLKARSIIGDKKPLLKLYDIIHQHGIPKPLTSFNKGEFISNIGGEYHKVHSYENGLLKISFISIDNPNNFYQLLEEIEPGVFQHISICSYGEITLIKDGNFEEFFESDNDPRKLSNLNDVIASLNKTIDNLEDFLKS